MLTSRFLFVPVLSAAAAMLAGQDPAKPGATSSHREAPPAGAAQQPAGKTQEPRGAEQEPAGKAQQPGGKAQHPGGKAQQPGHEIQQGMEGVEDIPIPTDRNSGQAFPLTLDDALRLGLHNNTNLRVSEILPKQAAQDLRGASAVFEPELYANASAAQTKSPSQVIQAIPVAVPEFEREIYQGRFGLRQLVPSGGQVDLSFAPSQLQQSGRPDQYSSELALTYTQPLLRGAWSDYGLAGIHMQESRRAAAEERYARSVQDTLFSVVQAYWNLVFVRENYRVAFQALQLARRQLERTQRRIQVGELAPLDRVADEAEVARREEELVTAENDIRSREDDLRRLLFDDADGRLWQRNLQPTDGIGEIGEAPELDWRQLALTATGNRPDLRAYRADASVADEQLLVAERDVLPRLDLVGSYTTDSARSRFRDAFEETYRNDFPDWSLQLQLSIPIGNNAARANRDRARLEVERTRRVLYSAEMDVALQVRDAVRRIRTLAETIARGRESVRLAATNLEREIARKDAGTSTTFEVQQRNQELQEARSRLLRNQLDYRIAEANLLYVQGLLKAPEAGEGTEEGH